MSTGGVVIFSVRVKLLRYYSKGIYLVQPGKPGSAGAEYAYLRSKASKGVPDDVLSFSIEYYCTDGVRSWC